MTGTGWSSVGASRFSKLPTAFIISQQQLTGRVLQKLHLMVKPLSKLSQILSLVTVNAVYHRQILSGTVISQVQQYVLDDKPVFYCNTLDSGVSYTFYVNQESTC
jgi:hypothetical protein